ncbi:steroid 17-alpha-hydroxylase/17,20 lyase isoform X5 [Syngnathoides biaculeatus]|uniref:steroid 17-alpha-hydroxylase/17,20 lyase isoform X5 n=1 Tax=Syngnathoides biaculeatus TaxID=300417 RepID=UPI002ADD7E53|nr:steroid 17-alpha-hydroxylase/17,20 lyase isoform X5 [Syngnathoides biaculeatus]
MDCVLLCLYVCFFMVLSILAFKIRLQKSKEELPCLPTLPFIGSLLSLRSVHPPHVLFKKLQEKYGQTYSLMMGSHRVIIVNQYSHAKEVLLKKGKIFAGRPRTVTTDVLTREGKDIAFGDYSATWKFHRKLVHEALHMFGQGSASIEKIICSQAQCLCSIMSEKSAAEESVDFSPDLTRVVTNVICSLCFNSTYSIGDPEFEAILLYSQGILDTVAKDSLVDIFPWLQVFPNADLHLLKQCVSIRDTVLQKKYEEHKVQKRIQEEIDSRLGGEQTPLLKDRGSLPYLEATIREVLRIRPVSPLLIPHVALKDTSLGNCKVRKGTRVIVNLWSLHHDEKEWKNPDLFDPGRFLNSEGTGLINPSSSYLPFGAGVRVCLGEALAKMELFIFLSWILQRFTFSTPPGQPPPDLEGKFGVVLQPVKYKVELSEVGWRAFVNSSLQLWPQILNWIQVWTLTWPFYHLHTFICEPFHCRFGFRFWIIVLLEDKSLSQSQVVCRLQQFFFQNGPLFGSIHLPINFNHLPCPC